MRRRLALLAVVLAAFAVAPAVADAHTMSCGDAFNALGRTSRGNANTAWKGCQGVGGSWLRLNVLGRSGRWYSWRVHHLDVNCWWILCDRRYVFYPA